MDCVSRSRRRHVLLFFSPTKSPKQKKLIFLFHIKITEGTFLVSEVKILEWFVLIVLVVFQSMDYLTHSVAQSSGNYGNEYIPNLKMER